MKSWITDSLLLLLLLLLLPQVSQTAVRHVANEVFAHLHRLDLSFHLSRQTGALNRVIDRGTRGINWVLSSMVFNVVPTIFEVIMVSAILTVKCGPSLAALTFGTLAAYTAFTFSITQVRAVCGHIRMWDYICGTRIGQGGKVMQRLLSEYKMF